MFFANSYWYYIPLALEAICVLHCIRKGNQNKWIWIIVCVPLVGCIAYFFSEILTGNDVQKVTSGMGSVFSFGGSIRRLEEQLRFSDTFHNRVALADAYLAAGQTDRAIELYEESLTGVFTENEHVLKQLIIAYANVKRYDDILPLAKKIYRSPQFPRSKAHIIYAMALGYTGHVAAAEQEFKVMNGRYSNFEARYQYAIFLSLTEREEEARQLLRDMISEAGHLSAREKRASHMWIGLAKEELRKMNSGNMEEASRK